MKYEEVLSLQYETYLKGYNWRFFSNLFLCSQSDFLYQTTGMRVMAICPGYTTSEIIPDVQGPVIVTYKDEWMDAFYTELENFKPPQE